MQQKKKPRRVRRGLRCLGQGSWGQGLTKIGLPLRRHDTMASRIRYGYWTKGQPERGQHRRPVPPIIRAA
jgi:hypothetical protein